MRFRAGISLIYPLLIGVALSSGVLINAGCGGGSSDAKPVGTPTPIATPTPTPTPPPATPVPLRAAVIWGPRSRQAAVTNAVGGPSSALSAIIRLTDPSGAGTPFTQTVNRGVNSGRQEYTSPNTIRPGIYNLQVQFFANENGTGSLVGTAAASATVLVDGTLSTTIATFGTIQKVVIPAGQFVNVGQTKDVIYEPRDASDNLIAVTPGSAFVTLVSQQSTVADQPAATVQAEQITGVNPIRATVTVKVDDAVSAPTDIAVRASALRLTVTPNPVEVSILLSQQFTANITNDGPAGSNGVTWAVKEGVTAGSITAGGLFTATRNEGVFTVVATSVYDPTVVVEVPVTVLSTVAVTVTPNPVPPVSFKGGTVQFTATVSKVPEGQDDTVVWTVKEGAAGGTITADGLYTSPATEGDFTVVATSRFDDRKFKEVTVPVRSLVTVDVTPNNPGPISINASLDFNVIVGGVPPVGSSDVTWSVRDAANNLVPNAIDADGLFTAPSTPGVYRIIATSVFDTNKSGSENITVQSGNQEVIIK